MPRQPEAFFKSRLREGFEASCGVTPHYWLPLVASMMQKAGIPDLFLADGRTGCWIEAKVNGNGLSNLQHVECRKLAMAGQIVVILHTHMVGNEDAWMVDRGQFTKDGMYRWEPACLRWALRKTPQFWKCVIRDS